jgi:hypothetical protein
MNNTPIGKLERVPLREVWEHEAYDFTQWLQENIDVLNTALDLNLVNVDREQAAGSFSIDLVRECFTCTSPTKKVIQFLEKASLWFWIISKHDGFLILMG